MDSPKRFCSLDTSKCYFRPEDCSLILLVGVSVGEQAVALSVCPPADAIGFFLPASQSPKVDDVFQLYDGAVNAYLKAGKALNDLQNKLGIDILPIDPLPPLPNLENTKAQAKKVADNIQNLQDLLLPSVPAAAAATYFFASAIVAANASVAGLGQPAGMAASARHLAAAAILLLKKYTIPDLLLTPKVVAQQFIVRDVASEGDAAENLSVLCAPASLPSADDPRAGERMKFPPRWVIERCQLGRRRVQARCGDQIGSGDWRIARTGLLGSIKGATAGSVDGLHAGQPVVYRFGTTAGWRAMTTRSTNPTTIRLKLSQPAAPAKMRPTLSWLSSDD